MCKEFSNRKRKELEQELEQYHVQRHFGPCKACFVYDVVTDLAQLLQLQQGVRLPKQEDGGHWFSAIIRQAK